MGAKITTEIDPYIKQVFEGVKDNLGLTYKDILEEGILAKIMDIDPVKAVEIEIMRLELELSDKKMHLATLRVSASAIKEKSAQSNKAPDLEPQRQEWFSKRAAKIARGIELKNVNWELLSRNGPFTSAKEAKEWVFSHLSECRKTHTD